MKIKFESSHIEIACDDDENKIRELITVVKGSRRPGSIIYINFETKESEEILTISNLDYTKVKVEMTRGIEIPDEAKSVLSNFIDRGLATLLK